MGALGGVELERVGDPVDDGLGDAGGVAPLEPDVVLRRHTGQQRHLLAPQPGDTTTLVAVGWQPRLLRGDPGTPRAKELTDLRPHLLARVPGLLAA